MPHIRLEQSFQTRRPLPFPCWLLRAALILAAVAPAYSAAPKIPPTYADVAYGPKPRQKLDVYVPQTGQAPYPILIWIHGGGWFASDKVNQAADPEPYLKSGMAMVSIEYRLVSDATADNVNPPVVAVLGDTRRALQYVRLHAPDWKLDPDKIVVAGGSAGALSSLYLGCEGERADPKSADPVERVSTKVLGVGAGIAQTTLDPQRMREWVPGVVWGYWAFQPGIKNYNSEPDFQQFLKRRDELMPYLSQYSPDRLLTKDAAPIYFNYGNMPLEPAEPVKMGDLVHSPKWGLGFQKLCAGQGVPCYIKYGGHPSEKYRDVNDFLFQQVGLKTGK
ncbi:MAG TPA: alpha/beta hydrolase [Chthoniobacter sp.]